MLEGSWSNIDKSKNNVIDLTENFREELDKFGVFSPKINNFV